MLQLWHQHFAQTQYSFCNQTNKGRLELQSAEMRMVRWICGIKLQDRVRSKELRERLGLDDIISGLQQKQVAMV